MRNHKSRTDSQQSSANNYQRPPEGKEELNLALGNACTLDSSTGVSKINLKAKPYNPRNNQNIPTGTSFYLWPLGKISQTNPDSSQISRGKIISTMKEFTTIELAREFLMKK
ncbi:hypothetical protein OnM2_107021 [Erysiphe neolycopersici]|uniref:Uncharacterized protein n=1 Tax=Erysiphe neolycopersici TaxID=212602 RepID=A0A420H708_9PEZI|nr:hypothetical protein OnM2_107021 [Erysiphe neolycopersici]